MHEPSPLLVDVVEWVDEARNNPVEYRTRRATHIILAAIAKISPPYTMYLKGGLLLGLVHNSPRATTDMDFTAAFQPREGIDTDVKKNLNKALTRVIAELGYAGSHAAVNKTAIFPKNMDRPLGNADFPALKLQIRHVSTFYGQQKTDHVDIDISFNELAPQRIDILNIGDGIEISAYSPADIVAEKYRALLQQIIRKRRRRQDVYDIDFLLQAYDFDADLMVSIHRSVVEKCRSRGINPDNNSLDDPEIRDRSGAEWESIALETGALPEFGPCFENVCQFYRSLPWKGG